MLPPSSCTRLSSLSRNSLQNSFDALIHIFRQWLRLVLRENVVQPEPARSPECQPPLPPTQLASLG